MAPLFPLPARRRSPRSGLFFLLLFLFWTGGVFVTIDQQTALERQRALYREKNDLLRQYLEPVEPFEFYREIFAEGSFERKGD